ncbi:hypothetical protein L1887_34897 [Cichorium endivia]|nr:hypothetical protein L1887_34897 [Cichorium endivia]
MSDYIFKIRLPFLRSTPQFHEAINVFLKSLTDFQSKIQHSDLQFLITHNLIAMEGCLQETMTLKKWNSSSETISETTNAIFSDNFDCNICLDTIQDPMVTLCGHLYCWPCIYKWIHLSHDKNPLCPVCKTEISEKTLIPLYVPTPSTKPTSQEKTVPIPRRPSTPSCGVRVMPCQQLITFQSFRQEVPNVSLPMSPTAGMFGEMVYQGLFGNSEDLFNYGESYSLAGISTRRARRQAIRDERSLGRICFFLLCCMMSCLVLF